LEEFNGYCKCSENKWISNEEISFSTDSASAGNPDLGVGLLFKKHWRQIESTIGNNSKNVISDITSFPLQDSDHGKNTQCFLNNKPTPRSGFPALM
jgi:hypothetical protein